jgi:hypothetical protein
MKLVAPELAMIVVPSVYQIDLQKLLSFKTETKMQKLE